MANYGCATRTNYFKVKDVEEFKALIKKTYSGEDGVEIFTRVDSQTGETLYGFGCYSSIDGIVSEEEFEEYVELSEPDYDAFIEGLQKIVADDDAIIIQETGNEKLRYVCGYATIITSKEVRYINMDSAAIEAAKQMLNNDEWTTSTSY